MKERDDGMSMPAYYKYNNGDLDAVYILDYDGKGRAWVRWKDGFVNLVECERLEVLGDDGI